MNNVKVARTSRPASVAGAIAGMVRDGKDVNVLAVGNTAITRACIATALACIYLQNDGIAIAFIPRILRVKINGYTNTLVLLQVVRLKEAQ